MSAQVAVAGIPFDANSSFLRGPALAPGKIREAYRSDSANTFAESGRDLGSDAGWTDLGDLPVASPADFRNLKNRVHELAVQYPKLFVLGGDHSITAPVVRGIQAAHGNFSILHIDAHPDLYDNFEDNPDSHASPFARIMEEGLVQRLVQVGIRTLNAHQLQQAKRFGVEIIQMKHWNDNHVFTFDGPVYLSLDMDAIDPAFAPGVSHHEPGGFTSRQIIHLLHRLKGRIIGADLVEFNPSRDPSGITAMLAGKLYKEMLDLLLRTS
ncbi:MAG: agmatinase [Cyclobacteriaceae bacterium]|nr:agmatinase [Cyclobacteriaceae bacterium]